MTTERAYSLADIRRAIDLENERHKRALERLNATLEGFLELDELIPTAGWGTRVRLPEKPEKEKIVFDPHEWGGKKRLLLRLIASEQNGLSSAEIIAGAQAAGLTEARAENVTPQLSTYKADELLFMSGANWCITPKGREFLNGKN